MSLIELPFLDKDTATTLNSENSNLPDLVDVDSINFIGHPARSHAGNFYVVNILVSGAKVDAKFKSLEEAIDWYNEVKSQKG